VENDFSDLPASARTLIAGNKNANLIAGQLLGIDEFKYIIPIIAVRGMGTLPEWIQPIENIIQQLQKNIPSSVKEDPQNYISSPWIISLIEEVRTHGPTDLISKFFKRVLLKQNIRLNIQLLYNEELELATPMLIEILEKNWNDKDLASAAFRRLTRVKNEKAFQLLRQVFSEENLSVKIWVIARKALHRMGKTRLGELTYEDLSSSDPEKRNFSIKCMIYFLEEKEVIEILTNLYKYNPDSSIRIKAIEALSMKKDNPNFIELMALELETGTNEKVQQAAARALRKINSKKSRTVLKQYFY